LCVFCSACANIYTTCPAPVHTVVTNALLIKSCDLLDLSVGADIRGSLGLFYADPPGNTQGECIEISSVEDRSIDDKALKCARVCCIMALAFGSILFVFGFFKQCICPLPCTQPLMDLSSSCVQICLALVYVIWLTDACDTYACSYGDGSTYLILTQIFWLVAGCFSRCMREGRKGRRQD
jgi:hypothetical protein